jgi:hypothetical protein
MKIIDIFNGNLYTDKKNIQFNKFLDGFNKYYNTNIKLIVNGNDECGLLLEDLNAISRQKNATFLLKG